MKKVFKTIVTGNIPKEWAAKLEELSEIVIWQGDSHFLMPRNQLIDLLAEVDAIVNFAEVKADNELLQNASKLKIIANISIGFDNLNLEELTQRGIWASNSPGFFNYPVAEYIFAGMLVVARNLGAADRFVRRGEWNTFEPGRWDGRSLREMSIGIIGMGAIGKELATLTRNIGMEVMYYDAFNKNERGFTELDEMLHKSDFVSINVPLTNETRKMVDRKFIDKMKDGAIFINTSRGTMVEQDLLVNALQTGKLNGAILDVFESEPEVPAALKHMENVFLTPHIAGGTKTARRFCVENAILNVYNVLSGKEPLNPLNKIP
jgi:phosphoglycerate dehydrogenase-like enzyme